MKLDVIFLELMIFLTATIDLTQAHADDMLEKQNCQRLLHPGGIFMGYPAVSAKELITLAITSKSKSLSKTESTYSPGDVLTITINFPTSSQQGIRLAHDSDAPSPDGQWVLEASNGAVFASTSKDSDSVGCDGKRIINEKTVKLKMPPAGSGDVRILAAWAKHAGQVRLSEAFIVREKLLPGHTYSPTSLVSVLGKVKDASSSSSYSLIAVFATLIGVSLFIYFALRKSAHDPAISSLHETAENSRIHSAEDDDDEEDGSLEDMNDNRRIPSIVKAKMTKMNIE